MICCLTGGGDFNADALSHHGLHKECRKRSRRPRAQVSSIMAGGLSPTTKWSTGLAEVGARSRRTNLVFLEASKFVPWTSMAAGVEH